MWCSWKLCWLLFEPRARSLFQGRARKGDSGGGSGSTSWEDDPVRCRWLGFWVQNRDGFLGPGEERQGCRDPEEGMAGQKEMSTGAQWMEVGVLPGKGNCVAKGWGAVGVVASPLLTANFTSSFLSSQRPSYRSLTCSPRPCFKQAGRAARPRHLGSPYRPMVRTRVPGPHPRRCGQARAPRMATASPFRGRP